MYGTLWFQLTEQKEDADVQVSRQIVWEIRLEVWRIAAEYKPLSLKRLCKENIFPTNVAGGMKRRQRLGNAGRGNSDQSEIVETGALLLAGNIADSDLWEIANMY